jgi:hypothetical protein
MPYHSYYFPGFQRGAGGHHMLNQRSTARAMQNLRDAGLQARALSRSENQNGKIISRHKLIILREQNRFRNVAIRYVS